MNLDPAQLAHIRAIAAEVRDLAGDDDATTQDTLEGETNALEVLDALIDAAQHASALGDATRQQAQRLTARARRFDEQERGYRKAMMALLDAMTLRKIVRPGATLSVSAGRTSLEVVDPAAVPSQLRKPGDPDRAAIRAQIEAGEDVPGCRLVTGDATIVMRVS